MKVKMLEIVQGREITGTHNGLEVSILETGEEYQVSETLGAWLVEHRKAVKLDAAHYGAQAEPELRNDEEVYEKLAKASAKEEGEPIASTQTEQKRAKRGRK